MTTKHSMKLFAAKNVSHEEDILLVFRTVYSYFVLQNGFDLPLPCPRAENCIPLDSKRKEKLEN